MLRSWDTVNLLQCGVSMKSKKTYFCVWYVFKITYFYVFVVQYDILLCMIICSKLHNFVYDKMNICYTFLYEWFNMTYSIVWKVQYDMSLLIFVQNDIHCVLMKLEVYVTSVCKKNKFYLFSFGILITFML